MWGGGCHELESGQEKVVRHQLCKARVWEQSPREKGAQGPRAQERERGGGRKAHAREGERGGARPTREKEQEGAQGHAREKEWDQSPRCRTRRVSVTERRP